MRHAPLLPMLLGLIVHSSMATPAKADDATSVRYISAAQIDQATSQPTHNGAVATQLSADSGTPIWAIRKDTAGEVELHKTWNDVIIARDSGITILVGKVEGNREIKPNEWLGGTIVGGTSFTLKSGDMLLIPAGLGHRLMPVDGKPFSYLVIKTAAHTP
jgi:hypothetical protein